MIVNFSCDSHNHGVGEISDATSATAELFLVHAVPVYGLAEGFFLDEVVALANDSSGSAR